MKIIEKEFIFDKNPDAPSCHASTVLPVSENCVLAAWFAGSREGRDDVGIWFSRKTDSVWSEPVRLSPEKDIPHWNPVLYMMDDGTVALYYKTGKKIAFWQTKVMRSKDNGLTWSEPEFLVENDMTGGRGPVKNKCIKISNDNTLAPASTEQKGQWKCFIDISEDDGISFEKQDYIVRPRKQVGLVHMIQPTLWESENGIIHCLMRTDKGRIYRSDSNNYGKKWCRAYATELPNNNSGIDLVKASDGNLYLVYNPVSENWGKRTPVTLAKSGDNGFNWDKIYDLDIDGEEFSYPAITCLGNCLYITYTFNRDKIRFYKIMLTE